MTDVVGLAELADRLSGVLSAETALLEAFDLVEAGAMLDRKREALTALQDALATQELAGQTLGEVRDSLARMSVLARVNRAALERGLAAQQRVIQAIAHAAPKAMAADAPIYRSDGSKAPLRPPQACAFLDRL